MTKTIKVTGNETIEVKRLHLPVAFIIKCPKCSGDIKVDLGDDYLSYPILNSPENVSGMCHKCDEYRDIPVTLRIELDIDEDNITLEEDD